MRTRVFPLIKVKERFKEFILFKVVVKLSIEEQLDRSKVVEAVTSPKTTLLRLIDT